jgi:metal-sulfur cluster biosynthetic enzyme
MKTTAGGARGQQSPGHGAAIPGGDGGAMPVLAAPVLAALATVRDPELDESITSLGFVTACTLSPGGDAEVRLRLPTYFCAPNFAFLMVADAYDAVTAVPGVRSAVIVLEDHFAAEAINGGVAARAGFARSFAGEAAGELQELRAQFLCKAVLAGTDQVCRDLQERGADPERLAGVTLAEVPPSAARDRLVRRRAELGLPAGDDALLLIDPATGQPVPAAAAPLHLRRARVSRISIESNGSICRGMLRHRYDASGVGEEEPE